MIYYQPVNFKCDPWAYLPNRFAKTQSPRQAQWLEPHELAPELQDWANNHGLTFEYVMYFRYAPDTLSGLHTDALHSTTGKTFPQVALNWSRGGGSMVWSTPADPGRDVHQSNGANYRQYKQEGAVEVARYSGTGPVLVRVNTPHQAHCDSGIRETITVRWKPEMTFEQAQGLFQ
jgi:hypothetical protein